EPCPADGLVGPVASSGDRHISANRGIAVPTITPDAGHLKRGLIEHHIVRLIGVGTGIVSRHRNVDRGIDYDRSMQNCSEEVAIAAIAGAVISRVGREEWPRIRRKPPRAWCIVPERILDAEVTAVRYTPNTHGCCPTEIASRRLDGRSRTQERMSPRQAKSRVV